MYHRQKGRLPRLARLLGLLLPGIYILLTARFIPEYYASFFADATSANAFQYFLLLTYFSVGLYLWPILVALLCFSIFPQIAIDDPGLKYRYLHFFNGRIRWQEIEKIVIYPNGIAALIISRRGMSLFNGLYMFRVHALLVHLPGPVLLVSSEIEDIQDPIRDISQRSEAMVTRRR